MHPMNYVPGLCNAVFALVLWWLMLYFRINSLAPVTSCHCLSANELTTKHISIWFTWIHQELWWNEINKKHNNIMCLIYGMFCFYCRLYIWCRKVIKSNVCLNTGGLEVGHHLQQWEHRDMEELFIWMMMAQYWTEADCTSMAFMRLGHK